MTYVKRGTVEVATDRSTAAVVGLDGSETQAAVVQLIDVPAREAAVEALTTDPTVADAAAERALTTANVVIGVPSPAAAGGVVDASNWASETTPNVTGNVPGTVLDRWEGRRNPAASRIARRRITVTSQAEFDAAFVTIANQGSFGWWWDIILTPGLTLSARELVVPVPPSKVRLICPIRHGATISLDNPDGSGTAVTNIQSALWPIWDCELIGVKVTTHNGRYALHHDQDGTNTDSTQLTEDCFFEHLGNSDPTAGVWRTPPAWGSGVASGQRTVHRRTVFRSAGEHPYAVHSNRPYTRPAVVRMEDCILEVAAYGNSGDGRAILLASLGSQVTCRLDISGTRFRGLHYIEHVTAPWRATDGSSPHVEWDVRLSGSDTIGWLDSGTATDGTTPAPDASFYPEQVDKEIRPVASGAIPRWSAVVFDGTRDRVKIAPTTTTPGQFVGIALFAAAAGERVRVLRDAKLFPTQTVGITTAGFDAPVYLSTTTAGGLTTTAGGPQVGLGVGIKNLVHVIGRKDF